MVLKIGVSRGHGKYTPGKRSPEGEREWYFNDTVADAFIAEMKRYDDVGIIEVSDPSGEVDTGLVARTNYANKQGVDVYIAFHHNAYQGKWFNGGGSEVHVRPNAPQSHKLASITAPLVAKAMGLTNRGVKVTNLHETREPHQLAILIEGGFMDSNQDIVAMRDKNKLRAQGEAVAQGVVEYFGLKKGGNATVKSPAPKKEPVAPPKPAKTISDMADEVEAGKHGSGHTNRRKSLGVSASVYKKVRDEVNRRAGVKVTSKPKPKSKSVNQMADEVLAGKHGSGHANRRRSLGVNASTYAKVRAEVNRRAGVSSTAKKSKSIEQMAQEVVAGKHGQGHANRQRSLGVNNATYQKVRAKVNQMYK